MCVRFAIFRQIQADSDGNVDDDGDDGNDGDVQQNKSQTEGNKKRGPVDCHMNYRALASDERGISIGSVYRDRHVL